MSKAESRTETQEKNVQGKGHLEVIPLGGMGEIGKNMFAFRFGDEIMVVDGGLAFPDSLQPGVDLIVPRIDYLQQNADMIKGWVLTHGHEDHIGGLPYIMPRLPTVPVYGASLTLGLVREKLSEYGVREVDTDLREIKAGETVRIGQHFVVEFFRMTHSIPDNLGYILHTPVGQVIHTGDFKLDAHPPTASPVTWNGSRRPVTRACCCSFQTAPTPNARAPPPPRPRWRRTSTL